MHVYSLLQNELYFCSCFEQLIFVGLQQTIGYHVLRLFSLVILCTVDICSFLIGYTKSYFLKIKSYYEVFMS